MLTVTETASRKLGEILSQHTEPVVGLRVHILPGGCSGFSYGMTLAERQEENDWVGEFNGIKVLVDPDSAPLLQGADIDFVETVQGSGFTIRNPNAVSSCGCGKSFKSEDGVENQAQAQGGGCGCGNGGGGCGCGGH